MRVQIKQVQKARRRALQNHQHHGIEPSKAYIQHGCCYDFEGDWKESNFTMFEEDKGKLTFLECNGPNQAFKQLNRLEVGTPRFAKQVKKCWLPMCQGFLEFVHARQGQVEVVVGDALEFLSKNKGTFDFVDTSNLMDYCGLWNVLLLGLDALKEGGCLSTEHIMGSTTKFKGMLSLHPPIDPDNHEFLIRELGILPTILPSTFGILRVDWSYSKKVQAKSLDQLKASKINEIQHMVSKSRKVIKEVQGFWLSELRVVLEQMKEDVSSADKIYQSVVASLKSTAGKETEQEMDEETAVWQMSLFKIIYAFLVPVPMTEVMLNGDSNPIDEGYVFPTATLQTLANLLRRLSVDKVKTVLKRFFDDASLCGCAYVRNRTLGFKTEIQSELVLVFTYKLKPLSSTSSWFENRGGVFEPSLAVFLLRDAKVLESMMKNNGKWAKENDKPILLLFEWLGKRKADQVQVVDNLFLEPRGLELSVRVDPHGLASSFQFLVLVDIIKFEVLSEPVLLGGGQGVLVSKKKRRKKMKR